MAKTITTHSIDEALTRGIEALYPSREAVRAALGSGKKLKLYLGIDPTSPHLHLGHAASLLTLSRFQDLGHKVVLLIGDFTARIGDPTDKLSPRQPLTEGDIKKNLKTFKAQAAKMLLFKGANAASIDFNSRWHDTMKFGELIRLAQQFTVQQMIERDMFQKRLKEHKPIGVHEFLYPLMQGYDSVAMNVDGEIGGTDQTFNMLAGRTLMKSLRHKEKFVIANRLLVDPMTGKKLSKTEGSLVNLDDAPGDMFGKVMALPDGMIASVAELSTRMPMEDIARLGATQNPRDAKMVLAYEVVKLYHSEAEAKKARDQFEQQFSKKEIPENIPTLEIAGRSLLPVDVIVRTGVCASKSEARRLVVQGAFEVNSQKITDGKLLREYSNGDIVRIGKRHIFRIG